MKLVQGPRPWSIWLFAALFLLQAAITFGEAITHLPEAQEALEGSLGWALNRDWAIVITSARLAIALIPVALVWFAASRFARWLVLAMVVGRLLMVPTNISELPAGESLSLVWLAALALSLCGAALLFTPSAGRWFARSRR